MLPEMDYEDISKNTGALHEDDINNSEPKMNDETQSEEDSCVIEELVYTKQDSSGHQSDGSDPVHCGSYGDYTMGLAQTIPELPKPEQYDAVFQVSTPNTFTRCECAMCGLPIVDSVFLMDEHHFHGHCLCCCCCRRPLVEDEKCYVKDGAIYCKDDYMQRFSPRCSKCFLNVSPLDWVRKAQRLVFHLACFSCDKCEYSLATGDSFGVLDGRLFCKNHYQEKTSPLPSPAISTEPTGRGQKRKRARTTFSEDQLRILQAHFEINQSPHGESLQEISKEVGLSKRVTQVWFQNARAKIRQQKIQKLS